MEYYFWTTTKKYIDTCYKMNESKNNYSERNKAKTSMYCMRLFMLNLRNLWQKAHQWFLGTGCRGTVKHGQEGWQRIERRFLEMMNMLIIWWWQFYLYIPVSKLIKLYIKYVQFIECQLYSGKSVIKKNKTPATSGTRKA